MLNSFIESSNNLKHQTKGEIQKGRWIQTTKTLKYERAMNKCTGKLKEKILQQISLQKQFITSPRNYK